ncbi:ABC transporter permease [Dactylosporangium sp. NPDC000555]|uniref:ABC transporter permease n=1 Tax=Dactylosporangium sp. NPDC000555 TaxID=3154260 RepID=UPI0033266516
MVSTTGVFASGPVTRDATSTSPRWWLSDAWQMALRNLRRIQRTPELVMYAVVQPLMFILLFAYVFGGAINVGGVGYRQFLMPGIFVMMVLFSSVAATTVTLAEDMQRGIIDRFRSMPMTRSSVLVGRTLSELIRTLVAVVVMIIMGLVIGFRFHGGFGAAIGGFALLLLFGTAFAWIGAVLGLTAPSTEAASSAGTVWLFPFAFISSAFVPTGSMPGWLRVYADHSPVTVTVNALRDAFERGQFGSAAWQSLIWSVCLLAVFAPLATTLYARRSR